MTLAHLLMQRLQGIEVGEKERSGFFFLYTVLFNWDNFTFSLYSRCFYFNYLNAKNIIIWFSSFTLRFSWVLVLGCFFSF